mmetsp:Transcript_24271/g.91591  ORF Transcript_24271/g.91591 Transcript_24271/m.91591 type:complete len:449 (+) Transcript_24271:2079-3425(+)
MSGPSNAGCAAHATVSSVTGSGYRLPRAHPSDEAALTNSSKKCRTLERSASLTESPASKRRTRKDAARSWHMAMRWSGTTSCALVAPAARDAADGGTVVSLSSSRGNQMSTKKAASDTCASASASESRGLASAAAAAAAAATESVAGSFRLSGPAMRTASACACVNELTTNGRTARHASPPSRAASAARRTSGRCTLICHLAATAVSSPAPSAPHATARIAAWASRACASLSASCGVFCAGSAREPAEDEDEDEDDAGPAAVPVGDAGALAAAARASKAASALVTAVPAHVSAAHTRTGAACAPLAASAWEGATIVPEHTAAVACARCRMRGTCAGARRDRAQAAAASAAARSTTRAKHGSESTHRACSSACASESADTPSAATVPTSLAASASCCLFSASRASGPSALMNSSVQRRAATVIWCCLPLNSSLFWYTRRASASASALVA